MNKKFIELYDYAVLANRIPKQIEFDEAGIRVYEYLVDADRDAYERDFIYWLRDIKGLKIDDNSSYINAVNKSNFLEFLKYQDEIDKKNNSCIEAEIKSFKGDEIIKTFEHKLNDTQLNNLLILINEIKLFKNDIDIDILKEVFECSIIEAIQTNNNQTLSHLFNQLKIKELICEDWQNTIEINKLFIGKRLAIITSNNLSVSLNKVNHQTNVIKKITTLINSFN